ncbi:inner membrane protein YbjM [Kosakonia sp. BYX6]|uniref:Inner membrane protein YbjM n=1 Tax=Kosakonia calanthes TaxID=3139408 RepID=A0ABZ3B1A8_9ENTR
MKNRRSWVGVICCSLLFIAVCLFLVINMKDALPASGDPEFGLLLFVVPGVIAGLVARRRRAIVSVIGAALAAPICYLLIHLMLSPVRSFWQEVAWLFSAIFWCGMGGLCCWFVHKIAKQRKRA